MTRNRILLGACILCVALPGLAAAQLPDVAPVRVGVVAEKLGVKVLPSAPSELEFGHSATTTLDNPKKIAPYGIKGMHEGARVTITCIGPNRVLVEADELEPVEQRAKVTLRMNDDGTLTQVAERTPPPPSPAKPPLI